VQIPEGAVMSNGSEHVKEDLYVADDVRYLDAEGNDVNNMEAALVGDDD
jgi:hypothetical protein